MDSAAFRLDPALLRLRANRAAARYDEADFLAREVAQRMDERLDCIRYTPRRILDLGCGTGADLARLGERYPAATRIGLDFAAAMLERARTRLAPERGSWQPWQLRQLRQLWQRLCARYRSAPPALTLLAADARRVPLADASVSLIWSNLTLPLIDAPHMLFAELHRTLEPGGLLMFSTLGPDTLRELRAALPARSGGGHVHHFTDMHDLGDALIQAGFTDPVLDMEMLTLTYSTLDLLLADLRANGATNAATHRARRLSRADWAAARAHYERLRRDGVLPASVEIIQGHAWKSAHRPAPDTLADGRAIVRFHPRRASQ
ncbi:malonyl-[acyl-carrier protein] O-methyltransferase [Betaproteobacteria bacterium]|nr:malonyl-[acyl-carrier protein] O-methyltransferase [Betaproteobacteria bacterium]GHU24480.1 malonyl-[acyl-carrier protein] O-methyltransferase [Betaproteobacteria bacterium]